MIERAKAVLPLLLLAVHAANAAEPVRSPSPLEGKWLQKGAGDPDDVFDVGLDIAPDAQGRLIAKSYVTATNFYGVTLGAVIPAGPAKYGVEGEDIDIVPDGDTLKVDGLVGRVVALRRVPAMPTPPPRGNVAPGPGPRWRVRLGGAIYAPVAAKDGVAYVGNVDGVLFAVKVADGAVVWSFPAGRPIYGGALVAGDGVYFACDNGWLFRLDRGTGHEVWRYDLGDARAARIPPNPKVFDYDAHAPAPVLADGVVYVGSGDGGFHAVSAADGKRVWRIDANGKVRGTAALDGDHVIFGTMGGWVVAVDRRTGREAWTLKTEMPFTGGPAALDGVVIAGNRGSLLRGLDAKTGAELWKRSWWGSWVESTAEFRDGKGYIGSGDLYAVMCFEPKTGHYLWRTKVNGWVLKNPAVTERHVVAGVASGQRNAPALLKQSAALTVLDRATGRIVWSWPMPEWPGTFVSGFVSAPAVEGGTILAAGMDGTLYGFPEP